MSFGIEVAKWARDSTQDMAELHQLAILKLFSTVILQTPVGNPDKWESLWKDSEGRAVNPPEGYIGGRLRGNWQFSSDSPKSGELDVIDPEGNKTVANMQQMVLALNFEKDFDVFLTNNLPYAYRIEYGGHSKQAPEGMVRKNLIRISNNLKA